MEYCAPALVAYANPQDQSEQNIKTKNNKNKKTKKQKTFTVAICWAWLGTAPRQRDWSSDSLVPLENMRTKVNCFGEITDRLPVESFSIIYAFRSLCAFN